MIEVNRLNMKNSFANHVAIFIRTIFTMLIVTYISGFMDFVVAATLYWMSFAVYGFTWIPYVGQWLISYFGWFHATFLPIIIQCCLGFWCMYLTLQMVKTKHKRSNVFLILLAALLTYLVYGFYMHFAMWYYSRLVGCLACIYMVLLFIYLRKSSKIVVPQPKGIHTIPPPPPPPPMSLT